MVGLSSPNYLQLVMKRKRNLSEATAARIGKALRRFAVFEALVATFGRDISQWPPELQQPDGPRVAAYANLRAHAVAFGMYLQWCASEQLAGVAERASARGIRWTRAANRGEGCERLAQHHGRLNSTHIDCTFSATRQSVEQNQCIGRT